MIAARIPKATRVIGKSQGFVGLPIRDMLTVCEIGNGIAVAPTMTSAWTPSPEELRRLNAGASVYLIILGCSHPPVQIEVGPVMEESE